MGSLKSAITTLLFFFLCFNTGSVSGLTYVDSYCPNATLFAPNGTYHRNLISLLSSLSSNATKPTDFYNLNVGRDTPDVVYGHFLCRGDVSTSVCKDCVETAAADMLEICPTRRVSTIWYDECTIGYTNSSFFSPLADQPWLMRKNASKPSDPNRFSEMLGTTIKDACGRAALDQSGKKFAAGEANFTSSQRLYTLAQCTPNLSADECNMCFGMVIVYLTSFGGVKLGGRVAVPNCNVRFEMYPFYNRTAVPPPPSAVTPPPTRTSTSEAKGKKKISAITVVAIVVPIVVFLVLFIIGFCILTRRTEKQQYNVAAEEDNVGDDITNEESFGFSLSTIGAATNNFSADNKLGEGGFGVVYKGTLPDGREIAVKRLSRSSGQGKQEFENEVVLVAKLQHRNLVRLLGFCLDGRESILVYEFVPNKSLDYFLFDPEKQGQLDWSRRYKIIGGIARGILYLHEDSRLRIIHRDLKASNVLLDRDMNPKVSDFGMARIFQVDQTQGSTRKIAGTYGYMSPEYAMHGKFSVKSDVYSFGVLILEIISGKKNSNFNEEGAEDLINYAWKLWRDETPLHLTDPVLRDSCSRNEVIRCIHIALLCVQEDPSKRPSMASICLMLESNSITLALAEEPTFSRMI